MKNKVKPRLEVEPHWNFATPAVQTLKGGDGDKIGL
jgi:hypothetical protein